MRHEIRALYDENIIRVYQAFRPEIADAAVAAGRFVPPFSMTRMTWIKPSFNWTMYRSGFARKPGQERVLAIDMLRSGFAWALQHATLSAYNADVHASPDEWRAQVASTCVRVQWDPERDDQLQPIASIRSVQIGLSGEAVIHYVQEWTTRIVDVTDAAHQHEAAANAGTRLDQPASSLERLYPVDRAEYRTIVP